MNTTPSTKTTDAGALPKRNPKSGRFEKGTVKSATTAKPAVDKMKSATAAKPAVEKTKKA
jgi:hypothetical protein